MAVTCAVGLAAVVFRLFTLRGLPNDHFMHLVWAQQLLFGELPGRDFIDPGMPLMYTLSAGVQYLWPGPFSEAVLTVTLLGLATVAITLVGVRLSGSLAVGACAGLFAILIRPRLYNYPKLLVPAVALLLFHWYDRASSTRRLCAVAAWVAVGFLFRHDLGAMTAMAVTGGLVVKHFPDWRALTRALAVFVAAMTVALLPYGIYVAATEGLVEHLRIGAEFAKTDAHQFTLELPKFEWAQAGAIAAWSTADSALLLVYASRALVVAGLVTLVIRWRRGERAASGAALLVVLGLYSVSVLRHPITARIPDLAAPLALAIAWIVGGLPTMFAGLRPSMAMPAVTAALTIGTAVLAADVGRVRERLIDVDAHQGPGKVYRGLRELQADSTAWPWSPFWPSGAMPEITRYVEHCTAPTDRLLVTWFGPEYYYFTKRPFGGGLGLLYPGRAFTDAHDQAQMIVRMGQHRVPIVLINDDRDPISGYPLLADYLSREYRTVGSFTMYDQSRVQIAVSRSLRATTTYGRQNWPCTFEPGGFARDS